MVFFVALFFLYQNWEQQFVPAADATAGRPSSDVVDAGHFLSVAARPESTPTKRLPSRFLWITTDVLKVAIDPHGGDIVSVALLQQQQDLHTKRPVQLLLDEGVHFYVAQSGLANIGGVQYPNHHTDYEVTTAQRLYNLSPGQDALHVLLQATVHGVVLRKHYVFYRGRYLVELTQQIVNEDSHPVTPVLYFQIVRDGSSPPESTRFISTFTGPALYTVEDKFRKLSFEHLADTQEAIHYTSTGGWIALIQHYFVSAWVPPQHVPQMHFYADRPQDDRYRIGFKMPLATLAPGQHTQQTTHFFAGPQQETILKTVAPGFDLVRDYGWLTLIAEPIFFVLHGIDQLVGNWGWSIILLTILIKCLFFPLSAASYRSMAKMRMINPTIQLLRERYAEDRVQQHREMMELFKREQINPMAGCVPILIQIPVFIALYYVLIESVELRQAPWILWVHDLSVRDPYYILPMILGLTTLLQIRLNPSSPDPVQAKVMLVMPIIFSVMFFFFPAGLVLYWTISNLFSITQQWYMTRYRVSRAV